MFQNSFSFKGRIRRLEYGLSVIIAFIGLTLINKFGYASLGSEIIFLFFIPFYWFHFAQGAKRCHDIDKRGWWQIIPFFGFWLLFEAGHMGINEFGPNPKGLR